MAKASDQFRYGTGKGALASRRSAEMCEKIARVLSDDVWVIAPEYDQSGVAHSLSLNNPLRFRQVAERRFAVRGTPTDCVIMGVLHLLSEKGPDLVLSGVNRGSNRRPIDRAAVVSPYGKPVFSLRRRSFAASLPKARGGMC
jgi:Survival protein SurE